MDTNTDAETNVIKSLKVLPFPFYFKLKIFSSYPVLMKNFFLWWTRNGIYNRTSSLV